MTPVRSCIASWSRSGSAARVRVSDPLAHPAVSMSAIRARRMSLSPPTEEQRAVVVPGYHVQVAAPGLEALNIASLPGNEEAALRGRHGGEPPLAVSPQEQAVAPVHAADFRLDAVEVAGQEEVEVTVAVEVGCQDSVHGRDLRLATASARPRSPKMSCAV